MIYALFRIGLIEFVLVFLSGMSFLSVDEDAISKLG